MTSPQPNPRSISEMAMEDQWGKSQWGILMYFFNSPIERK